MNQTVDTFQPGDRVKKRTQVSSRLVVDTHRSYAANAKIDNDRQGTVVKSVPRRTGRKSVSYRTYVYVLWDGKECEDWVSGSRLEKVNKLNEEES